MKILAILCLFLAVALGQRPPEKMTKMTVRLQSPGIPADHFAAKPRTIYRAGHGHCRTEELPDPEQGIHGLSIINEPDVWMVNLLSKTAQHLVDPGPTFNCRLPMFQDDEVKSAADMNNPILELEFGRELAYFRQKKGATPKAGPVLQGKQTNVSLVQVGDSQLFLFTVDTPERPIAVARQRGAVREIYWYGVYEELPFDANLFAKPEGVKIKEAQP